MYTLIQDCPLSPVLRRYELSYSKSVYNLSTAIKIREIYVNNLKMITRDMKNKQAAKNMTMSSSSSNMFGQFLAGKSIFSYGYIYIYAYVYMYICIYLYLYAYIHT
jgi:hypothetical protein